MKALKRMFPLLLVLVLTLGLFPMGALAVGDGMVPVETPTPSEAPSADTGSEDPPEPVDPFEPGTTPPGEAEPSSWEDTASPQPEETEQPETEASPSQVPEDDSSIIDGVSYYGQPWGEGIFYGPDDLSGAGPMTIAASGTVTIAVKGCTDSSGLQIMYTSTFLYDGRYTGAAGTARHIIYANDKPAYCLEPGKYLVGGSVLSDSTTAVWKGLGSAKQKAIKMAILCGAEGNASNLSGVYGSQYTATQMVIWEFLTGLRSATSPYTLSDSKIINSVCLNGANPEVKTIYDEIIKTMTEYNTLPSFAGKSSSAAPKQEMKLSGGKYTVVLTDSNKVLGNYKVTSSDSKVTVKAEGNKLTLTSTEPVNDVNITCTRKTPTSATSQITAYGANNLQEIVMGLEVVNGTTGWFAVYTKETPPSPSPTPTQEGSVEIVKTSDDGNVSGIQFRITGGGIDQLVTTDGGGRVKVDGLKPGSYTVYEQVPEGYYADQVSQNVTVQDGTTATVTFSNTLKVWRVSVTKVDADGGARSAAASLAGAVYGVFKGGQLQDRYTTDAAGQFTTKFYPCGTDWTLREMEAPTGYTVDPTEYPIGASPGDFNQASQDMTLTVKERIISGNLVIVKQDAETQTPLGGARFRVLDGDGSTVTEGETGPDGRLAVDGLAYGDYRWQEVSPPKYFKLDETMHSFSVGEDGTTITVTCDDHRIPGSITVHKNDTRGNSLAGATYLLEWSADGSSWQPVSYRDGGEVLTGCCTSPGISNGQLTTGSDGTVTFSGLRADGEIQYRLTETKAPAGMSLLKDPVYTGTLPVEGDSDLIYDISATVTDTRITDLPMTGSSGQWPVTVGTALTGLAAVAGYFYARNNKKRRNAK